MKRSARRPALMSCLWACAPLCLLLPASAFAANGITLTGFGSASAAMAGVDLAVADDTTALNSNPAGLAQLKTQAVDVYLEPFYTLDNAHEDVYNDKRDVNNRTGGVFGGGYAFPFHDGEFVAGIGLFAQGGVGYVYDNLNTAFGTRDDVSAIFGIFKLAPGLAWRVNEQLRVGLSLGISYGSAREKFFPDTSVYNNDDPASSFFGFRLDALKGWGYNGKLGVQYLPTDRLTLALAYTSKVPLNLDHGNMTVDYEGIGQGRVRYREASLQGLALPQELGLGAIFRLDADWRIGGEFNWMDYSRAIKALTLSASDPDNAEVPQQIVSSQTLDFRDVYVFAAALERRLNPKTLLRAGFSHANTTVPSENLSPTLALIAENLLTFGFSTELSPRWIIGAGLEYQIHRDVHYTNPALPFGPDATESNNALLLTVMLSQRW